MGGVEEETGEAQLYWMDYLGTLQRVTRGAHGYAGYFVSSVLDNSYKPEMTKEEGIECCEKCIHELKTRFMIDQTNFRLKVITKTGIEIIDM
jgi:20S proteasome subunit beta 4